MLEKLTKDDKKTGFVHKFDLTISYNQYNQKNYKM
jgi:hypothetical protein